MPRAQRGFTLIEVLACLLVLAVGLTAATGMVQYAMHLVRTSHGQSVGMATALTVLADPSPLATDPSLTPNDPTTGNATGYLNGLWVERRESDELHLGGNEYSVLVSVDVYDGNGGTNYASVVRRLIRTK